MHSLIVFVALLNSGDAYADEVKPLLAAMCYACHGALKQESGLRLDTARLIRQGGDSGPAVEPGDPEASLLIQRVAAHDALDRMPPEADPLTEQQIDWLRRWIAEGAPAPEHEQPQIDPRAHWAFQPLRPVVVPETDHQAGTTIDRFIRHRLAQQGLTPAAPADRTTLIRRLYLDMHGIPPTKSQVDRFLSDQRLDSYLRLVEQVLASPRYGERWAQHWLDVVRYADTHGFEVNTPRENAWPYRDYVVESLNADKPYQQFVIEQIAGDTLSADAATGFLVAAAVLLPGQIGKDDASIRLARQDALDEIVSGTSLTFFGLTVGCARCHDHKFDPISQREYYALQAFFAGVEYGDRPIRDDEYQRREEEIAELLPRIRQLKSRLEELEQDGDVEEQEKQREVLTRQLDELESQKSALEAHRQIYGGVFRSPDPTHVLLRGDPEQPADPVEPQVPEILGQLSLLPDGPESERRIALARWIASPQNPLTARVMVNRIWHYHFGTGLVATPSDFGLNGAAPSHPELLDWLAMELIDHHGSIKHIHRLILLSDTYRQSNRIDPAAQTVDAGNRLLWRFPSRRLEAESIRDSVLWVSGNLNLRMGGPGFDFFETRGGLSGFPPREDFTANELRRMVFAHKIRMEPVPVFGAFDCPDAGQATPRRSRSTTAIQALNLFNSPFIIEQSEIFAARVAAQADSPAAQIQLAFELVLARSPSETEAKAALSTVGQHGLATLGRVLLNSNEFLFIP